jgi:hypothetical protein
MRNMQRSTTTAGPTVVNVSATISPTDAGVA